MYVFGRFRFDEVGRVLYRGDAMVPLPPKAADALRLLLQHAGAVVEKDEFLKTLWAGTFVEEGSLARTISVLRGTLAAEGGSSEYIATAPKRGYRFAGQVRQAEAEKPAHLNKAMLVVLPFLNLSARRGQEFFADGLTEEMIAQLGRISPERLGVIARTSAMKYKDTRKSVEEIGAELGVTHVLEGSVRCAAGKVRITAQLIQVRDQSHLWAENYQRRLANILALQSEIAEAVARQIAVRLAPAEKARLLRPVEVVPAAYEACLRGRHLWNQRTRQSMAESVGWFQKAIHTDPGYAPAYAGLADTYLSQQDYGHIAPVEGIALAKRAAADAIRLDPELAEPHVSLAHACLHECDWKGAGEAFQRALSLNPGYATAYFYCSNYLIALGREQEAIAVARRAQSLDPLSTSVASNVAGILYHAHEFDAALQQGLAVAQAEPGFVPIYDDLGRAYEAQGMYKKAVAAFRKAVSLSGRAPGYLASLAHGQALAGDKPAAARLVHELHRAARKTYVQPYAFALAALATGDKDAALDWLEKSVDERSSAIPFFKVNPRLRPLHGHPRFQKILVRLGLASSRGAAATARGT